MRAVTALIATFGVAATMALGSIEARAQSVGERILGDPNAPVEIIEYSSLTCPHCASFHTDTLPSIKEDYIDTGKAKLVMRDFPLNEPAVKAAVVAHCAGDERYFRFLDALFKNQMTWAQTADVDTALVQFAKLGGLDE
ncbi:MAG: thioredoxin domain-containing protein, partial [Pseudomonadota bacterium]